MGSTSKITEEECHKIAEEECHKIAEEECYKIISRVAPTTKDFINRQATLKYLKSQISKVFPRALVVNFGSMPLNTYLSEGDIDISVIGVHHSDPLLPISDKLDSEQHNLFPILNLRRINSALVPIIKCSIGDYPVDISINGVNGLGTLLFLEMVNLSIQRYHLLKESIMLIKTWCYFQGNILGYSEGRMSTYALNILIVYIIFAFGQDSDGPFSVFLKFLEFYGTFDWEKFVISVRGPCLKSDLSTISANTPHGELLDAKVLQDIINYCSMPSDVKEFRLARIMNIIDPISYKSNLGGTINKVNGLSIVASFNEAAKALRQILSFHTKEAVRFGMECFFSKIREAAPYERDISEFYFSDLAPLSIMPSLIPPPPSSPPPPASP